jgi:hypothetical protein
MPSEEVVTMLVSGLMAFALLGAVAGENPPDRATPEEDRLWRENGKLVPDTPWRKSSGQFGAMLIVTDEPAEFFASWEKPSRPGYEPRISPAKDARRGDTVVAVVPFAGCRAKSDGHCNAEVDYRVERPDGSMYAEQLRGELWKDEPPLPKDRPGLANQQPWA